MRAFARGGRQALGLRVGRLCCNHGRPFLYGLAYVTRLPTFPGRPRDRFRVHPVVQTNLTGHDFRVETAETGRAALEAHSRFHPALLLLDLGLPATTSLEV